ncbi:uroporphyrinogen decarboxylase [candidate division KSB1 bacterium]|nr:thioredoxin family protein [candidate division KSB1 bacterium]RQW05101.1 MAG: uroporphyrinogen decarboxylase [candidate division KSB1 bacterium]
MTGRELVKAAMRCEQVERIPWVPFVGVHGGHLIHAGATDYLKSADLILAGMDKAIELYRPDGLPIVFDLQIEAEILGCDLEWAAENPPAVVSHPLLLGKTLKDLHVPQPDEGRLAVTMAAARRARETYPNVALYGLVTGPFTLALHLLGTDIFMKMMLEPDAIFELFDFTKTVAMAMSDYYIDANCDVIALVDPMTSQIGPEQFRQFVRQPVTEIFNHIRKRGALSSFFVCGHAQQNVEAMCECKPDNVSVDENIPLDFVRDVALPKKVSFGGNMQLTVILLLGSPEDAQRHAIECMNVGGETGFILAPGCDLPYSTPIKNLAAVADVVHDPYQQQVIQTLETTGPQPDVLDMSDYGKTDKVIVDIITIDSEACAPCQYMVESVKAVTPQFENIVEWREHKIKHSDSVQFMTSLMVKNIPTICIDGKITFVSRIPPKEELIAAIQKRIYEKLRFRIRSQKGRLLLFARNEKDFAAVRTILQQAMREIGAEVEIVEIADEKKMVQYGVVNTPAVVTAHFKIKSEGTVPALAAVKEWIKEIA